MLKIKSLFALTVVALGVTLSAAEANAQYRGGPRGAPVGRAVPRVYAPRVYAPSIYRPYATRIIAPRIVGVVPYRPYYYPYRPGVTFGFYSSYGYPYRYGYYGYPYYPYSSYGAYALPPPAYVTAVPGYSYGGVRIQGAPPDAQVFADGYYVGIVRDFDGALQHMNLTAGAHTIEIRPAGVPPISFQVNVNPGQTITYHAGVPY